MKHQNRMKTDKVAELPWLSCGLAELRTCGATGADFPAPIFSDFFQKNHLSGQKLMLQNNNLY